MAKEQTPEQKQAELNARVKGFNEEVLPLLKKYGLRLGATPGLTPDGRIGAIPQVFDDPGDEEKPTEEKKEEGKLEAA